MTVIVLSKHKDSYYLHSDSRCTQGAYGIMSDSYTKVYEQKDCIFSVCGEASCVLVMKALLAKTRDPLKLLRLLHHKEFKDILSSCSVLIATTRNGCYILDIDKKGLFDSEAKHSVVTLTDKDLPQMDGSGFVNVRSKLSEYDIVTPDVVKRCIEAAYKDNHTIGGAVQEVKLSVGKRKKK